MVWFATNVVRCCRVALPALAVWVLAGSLACMETQPAGGGAVALDRDDIGGVVSGANGPEAGVWVIAETDALPTNFIRIAAPSFEMLITNFDVVLFQLANSDFILLCRAAPADEVDAAISKPRALSSQDPLP